MNTRESYMERVEREQIETIMNQLEGTHFKNEKQLEKEFEKAQVKIDRLIVTTNKSYLGLLNDLKFTKMLELDQKVSYGTDRLKEVESMSSIEDEIEETLEKRHSIKDTIINFQKFMEDKVSKVGTVYYSLKNLPHEMKLKMQSKEENKETLEKESSSKLSINELYIKKYLIKEGKKRALEDFDYCFDHYENWNEVPNLGQHALKYNHKYKSISSLSKSHLWVYFENAYVNQYETLVKEEIEYQNSIHEDEPIDNNYEEDYIDANYQEVMPEALEIVPEIPGVTFGIKPKAKDFIAPSTKKIKKMVLKHPRIVATIALAGVVGAVIVGCGSTKNNDLASSSLETVVETTMESLPETIETETELTKQEKMRISMKEEAMDSVIAQIEDSTKKGLAYGQPFDTEKSLLFGNLTKEDQVRITLNYYLMKNRNSLLKKDSDFFTSIYKGQGQTAVGVRDDIFDYMNIIAFDSLTAIANQENNTVLELFGSSPITYGEELEYQTRYNNALIYTQYIRGGDYIAAKELFEKQRNLLVNNFAENVSVPDGEEVNYCQSLYNLDMMYASILPKKKILGRILVVSDTEYKAIFNRPKTGNCIDQSARTSFMEQLMLQIADQLNDDFDKIETDQIEFSEDNLYFNEMVDLIIEELENRKVFDQYQENPNMYDTKYSYAEYEGSTSKTTRSSNSSSRVTQPVVTNNNPTSTPIGTTVTKSTESLTPYQMEQENYAEKQRIDEELAQQNYVVVKGKVVYRGEDASKYGDITEYLYQEGYDRASEDFDERLQSGDWETMPRINDYRYDYISVHGHVDNLTNSFWKYFRDGYTSQYNSLVSQHRKNVNKYEDEPIKESHQNVPEKEVGTTVGNEVNMGGGDDHTQNSTENTYPTEGSTQPSTEGSTHESVQESVAEESTGEEHIMGGGDEYLENESSEQIEASHEASGETVIESSASEEQMMTQENSISTQAPETVTHEAETESVEEVSYGEEHIMEVGADLDSSNEPAPASEQAEETETKEQTIASLKSYSSFLKRLQDIEQISHDEPAKTYSYC